jgi:hypothetical protein
LTVIVLVANLKEARPENAAGLIISALACQALKLERSVRAGSFLDL